MANVELMPKAESRTKAVWGGRVKLAAACAIALALLAITSCSKMIRTGQSPVYLQLTELQGGAGVSGAFGSVLQSDVLNFNPATGVGSIAPDRGQATFAVVLKDPVASTPSPANAITLTQYHVEYVRSDGRNTQGVDVPYAFDGAVTLTMGSGGSVGFTLVRVQAKQEAPLQALAFGGGANTISTIARVTFYGHDQNGRDVSVTGNIEVDFSDWAG
jgi:hypothetical protein